MAVGLVVHGSGQDQSHSSLGSRQVILGQSSLLVHTQDPSAVAGLLMGLDLTERCSRRKTRSRAFASTELG